MTAGLRRCPWLTHYPSSGTDVPAAPTGAVTLQETPMQWTTPQAADFRFGFEITMYVAAR